MKLSILLFIILCLYVFQEVKMNLLLTNMLKFSSLIKNENFTNNDEVYNNKDEKGATYYMYELMKNITFNVVSEANEKNKISKFCYESVKYAYTGDINSYLYKLLYDSSHNVNDLGSHDDCTNINYEDTLDSTNPNNILPNITFFMIELYDKEKNYFADLKNFNVMGFCFINKCTEEEMVNLTLTLNKQVPIFNDTSVLKITDLEKNNSLPRINDFSWWLSLIPFFLFILNLIVVLFPEIPLYFFSCCYKSKNKVSEKTQPADDENLNSIKTEKEKENVDIFVKEQNKIANENETDIPSIKVSKIEYDNNLYYKIKKAFSFYENFEEVMTINNQDTYSPPGTNIIRGLRSLAILFSLYGVIFTILLNSPIIILNDDRLLNLFKNFGYCFITCGARYCIKLLFCYSGYLLAYKLFVFMDNQKKENSNDSYSKESLENNNSSTKLLNQEEEDLKLKEIFNENFNDSSNNENSISFKFYLKYLLLKMHRYTIYVYSIIWFCFSFYSIQGLMMYNISPMLSIFNSNYISFIKKRMASTLLLGETTLNFFYSNPFSIAINENLLDRKSVV